MKHTLLMFLMNYSLLNTYEAYIVDVPDELFPAELLRVLKEQDQLIRNDNGEVIGRKSFKSVTTIAPLKE